MSNFRLWVTSFIQFILIVSKTVYIESAGTTPNIRDIFMGRCLSYQEIIKPYPQSSVVCSSLWNQFSGAFSLKSPCDVTSDDYEPFVNSAITSVPVDKVMFWSGTYQVAHEYAGTGRRFVTLEDTLLGFIMNGLSWCGQTTIPGINYQKCPTFNECPESASTAFWGTASKRFAENAKGNVTVMLDGSNRNRPAYNKESYFSKFELPALSKEDVKFINVIVTHKIGEPYRETCLNGTIPELKQAIKDAGFTQTCLDNPQPIKHLLCVDDPTSAQCRFILSKQRQIFVG